ncbi:MAG: hypothetical protein QY332_07295 [Anaerolineales bacterium]|nr:MAG: hypothetical protein QY332_07295 [Anaerolineales bacterium]
MAYYLGRKEGERVHTTTAPANWWASWGQTVTTTIADFFSGVVYQAFVKNNLDPVMMIAPVPKNVKVGWYQSWEQLEIDSTPFTFGRIVGGFQIYVPDTSTLIKQP